MSSVDWAVRGHAFLVGLYPRSFRERFAQEMADVFAERAVALRARGRVALLAGVLHELRDIPRAAVTARLRDKRLRDKRLRDKRLRDKRLRGARSWRELPRRAEAALLAPVPPAPVSSCGGALLSACVLVAAELCDLHGLFCAPLYAVAAVGLIALAVTLGRRVRSPGDPAARLRRVAPLLGLAVVMAPSLMLMDHLYVWWLTVVASSSQLALPGLSLQVGPSDALTIPQRFEGLLQTNYWRSASGEAYGSVLWRRGESPAYELWIVIAATVAAWLSHRVAGGRPEGRTSCDAHA